MGQGDPGGQHQGGVIAAVKHLTWLCEVERTTACIAGCPHWVTRRNAHHEHISSAFLYRERTSRLGNSGSSRAGEFHPSLSHGPGRPLGGFYGMVSSDPAFGPKEATSSGLDTDLWEFAWGIPRPSSWERLVKRERKFISENGQPISGKPV